MPRRNSTMKGVEDEEVLNVAISLARSIKK
jgi:hypothetical protein